MPQQVNLCFPILLVPKRYFSAATIVQALAAFAVVGGSLCAFWVWSLHRASESFQPILARQFSEIQSLKSALARSQGGGKSLEAVSGQELQALQAELVKREKMLELLLRGVFQPGAGYAAQLQLVAQSIPTQVWITEVKANERQLEVKGFTLQPSALNDWALKLAESPLLEGQKLATIQVESTSALPLNVDGPTGGPIAPEAVSKSASGERIWSFSMLSAVGQIPALVEAKP